MGFQWHFNEILMGILWGFHGEFTMKLLVGNMDTLIAPNRSLLTIGHNRCTRTLHKNLCLFPGGPRVPPFFDLFQDHLLFQTANGRCHRSSSSWFTTSVTGNNSVRKPERIGIRYQSPTKSGAHGSCFG